MLDITLCPKKEVYVNKCKQLTSTAKIEKYGQRKVYHDEQISTSTLDFKIIHGTKVIILIC